MNEELKKIIDAHAAWARGAEGGERADLRGADLRGANLQDADLRGANLQDANLQDANLRDVDLSWANLCGSNLQDADLRGANLRGADLSRADLQDADLGWANLDGANLRGADLQDADLCEAIGNAGEVKSAQFDAWSVTWTSNTMAIGCQQHSIDEWFGFDDAKIASMDRRALAWWNKYKEIIRQLIEVSK